MILYKLTSTKLFTQVDALKPNWRTRALKRTSRFSREGKYFEPPEPIWSEIKPVFMLLQNHKCAYCERQLGSATIEFDLEHFRPKNAVLAWPPVVKPQYPFSTGSDLPNGYYLLAYNLENYAVACKPCNTNLKASYFPVASARITNKAVVADYVGEKPLLIFPIGDTADDPQTLIRFDELIPVPVDTNPTSYDYQRAQVTIDFFELVTREELLRERSHLIIVLFPALERADARTITIVTSPTCPHTNFAQCFQRLYASDPQKAESLYTTARTFLESVHDKFIQRGKSDQL